jgi:hypothetical protein
MLPDCEEIPIDSHDPNWYLPYTGSVDKANLKFSFTGLHWHRFAQKGEVNDGVLKKKFNTVVRDSDCYKMLNIDNVHLYQELRLYKKRSDRTGYTKVGESDYTHSQCDQTQMVDYMECSID